MPHYYLGQWVWNPENEGHWQMPRLDIGIANLDLRTLPQMAMPVTAQGFGMFALAVRDDSIGAYLGDSITAVLNPVRLNTIRNILDVQNLQATNVLDILWELFTIHADTSGQTRWRPLMPEHDGVLRLHLSGHSVVKEERFNPNSHPLVLDVVREGYRKVRAEALTSQAVLEHAGMSWQEARTWGKVHAILYPDGHPTHDRAVHLGGLMEPVFHKRYLQALVEKYRLPPQQLIPSDLSFEGVLPHGTSISENWNCADSANINCQLTWTEATDSYDIVTNRCQKTAGGFNYARADTDLASDDHYAQVALINAVSGPGMGSVVRKDGTATDTWYHAVARTNATPDSWDTTKVVAAVFTGIGTGTSVNVVSGDTIKVSVDGSTIKRFRNGTEQDSVTDTAITGNLRTGITMSTNTMSVDTFEAADLAAAAAVGLMVNVVGI